MSVKKSTAASIKKKRLTVIKKKSTKAKKRDPQKKVTDLSFTSGEMEMLRDIFGVVMPIMTSSKDEDKESSGMLMTEATISEYLAGITKRTKLEHLLWKKIVKGCAVFDIITGKDAPTFAVSAAHIPAMHVYRLEE